MRSSDRRTISRDVVRPWSIAARISAIVVSTMEKSGDTLRGACAAATPIATRTSRAIARSMMIADHTRRTMAAPHSSNGEPSERPGRSRRVALITGASSGIGEAFADVFAAEGFDLVIAARREDRLRQVAERLERQHRCRVHVITADFGLRDAAERLCTELAARGLQVDALVNNAGYGVPGAYSASPWARHDEFLQVMVTTVAELTYRLVPEMVERRYGRIVNV